MAENEDNLASGCLLAHKNLKREREREREGEREFNNIIINTILTLLSPGTVCLHLPLTLAWYLCSL